MLAVGLFGLLSITAGLYNVVHDDWKDLALHLGVDFLSAIVVFIAFEILLERIEEDKVRTYRALNHGRIIDNIYSASGNVEIWESWTNFFTTRKLHRHTFEEAIRQALHTGVTFRILLVRPGSAGMNKRQIDIDGEVAYKVHLAEQKWPDDKDVELNVLRNLQCFQKIRETLSLEELGRLSIRLYDSPPTTALYTWGEKASASFFPERELSDRIEQLEFAIDSGVGKLIGGQFEIAWDQGSPYKGEPDHMQVWLIVKDGTNTHTVHSFEAAFIRNDEEDRYGEDSYPFCIADRESGITGIATTFVRYGQLNIQVVCRTKDGQGRQEPGDDRLPDNGDRYYIEENTYPRMVALFDAKYGPDSARRIFRLTRHQTSAHN
jgi:hypothetical protein